MIASIEGKVVALEAGAVVIEAGGVGYRVHVPASQLADCGPVGTELRLHTHMHVRETEMELFGAGDPATLTLFKQLLIVSGVGPKVALAVLSTLDAQSLHHAILSEDIDRLTDVPGIGRKTAQRIILDLKSRLEDQAAVLGDLAPISGAVGVAAEDEAVEALMALGYKRGEARRALASVDPGLSLEQRIVTALQSLSS